MVWSQTLAKRGGYKIFYKNGGKGLKISDFFYCVECKAIIALL